MYVLFIFQDDSDNVTRFLMLAREPIIPRTDKPFKVSPAFRYFSAYSKTVTELVYVFLECLQSYSHLILWFVLVY